MFQCSFKLNDQPLSEFKLGSHTWPAFSGLGAGANKRAQACVVNIGPIPPGDYYIVDRQSGGTLGSLKAAWLGRGNWFSLFAVDDEIDDWTYCDWDLRGLFRLHPKGPSGRSEGCVVIERASDFDLLRSTLLSVKPSAVPRTIDVQTYGVLAVR